MKLIEEILKDRPTFHCAETEVNRKFDSRESFLSRSEAKRCATLIEQSAYYGVDDDVARYISETVGPDSVTLETGAGISTLIFAIKGATHTAITPSLSEINAIHQYAAGKNINLDKVSFISEPSEQSLPNIDVNNLDMVVLDGKHAFPWPMIDWFYTADKLRNGGIMMVDDAHIKSVGILIEFMKTDPGWLFLTSFGETNFVFRKECDLVHDVAWHMQPFNFDKLKRINVFQRIRGYLLR